MTLSKGFLGLSQRVFHESFFNFFARKVGTKGGKKKKQNKTEFTISRLCGPRTGS